MNSSGKSLVIPQKVAKTWTKFGLKLWVDSTGFELKWNKRRIRYSKLEGACGAGNNGILTKAPAGFEPAYGGFADLCLTTWLCRRICISYNIKILYKNLPLSKLFD